MISDDPNSCREFNSLNRRQFLGAVAAASSLPSWFPQVVLAGEQGSGACGGVFIEIFLRGGADGTAMIVPFGDGDYYVHRPECSPLHVPHPGSTGHCPGGSLLGQEAIDLDGFFGLAPALSPLHQAYLDGDLCIATGVALEGQSYSHFTAQHWMETGVPNPGSPQVTGYMARHINSLLPSGCNPIIRGIGVNPSLQRGLFGGDRALAIPDPASFSLGGPSASAAERLETLNKMYASSDLYDLAEISEASRNAIAAMSALDFDNYVPAGDVVYPGTHEGKSLRVLATIIKGDIGLQVAQIDTASWDFHSNQQNNIPYTGGPSTMWRRMEDLAEAMSAFHLDLKETSAELHKNYIVCVTTDFGRNMVANGSGLTAGTDHGHGTIMFLMGGYVNGGQVINGDLWPGLSQLHGTDYSCDSPQHRDLCGVTDPRELLAEVFDRFLGNGSGLPAIFPEFEIAPADYLGCIL